MKLFRGTSKKPFFRAYVRTFRTDAEKKIENAALFCNRYENNFSKTSFKSEEFKNAGFSFSCGRKECWQRSFSKTIASR